jgi:lysophospholipase L1-like esterase
MRTLPVLLAAMLGCAASQASDSHGDIRESTPASKTADAGTLDDAVVDASVRAMPAVAPRVGVIGDSLTNHAERRNGYIHHLASFCPGIVFDTYGIDGQGVKAMAQRFKRDIIDHGYDEVIIFGGVNDFSSGRTVAHAKQHLGEMYAAADQAGMRVIAVTVTPWKGYSSWTAKKQARTEQLNDWIRSRPPGVDSVVDAYSLLGDENDPARLSRAFHGGDHLHLSREGNRQLGNAIYDSAYQPLCARLREQAR